MCCAIPRTECRMQSWKQPVDCTTFETRTQSGGPKPNENLIPDKVYCIERGGVSVRVLDEVCVVFGVNGSDQLLCLTVPLLQLVYRVALRFRLACLQPYHYVLAVGQPFHQVLPQLLGEGVVRPSRKPLL